ncbi:hypothetical protein [Methylocella sp.]|uniref:hypothetical protein n=1 Tax=Methylocella sp. TaxID=1978226 RepID=UPI003C132632
MLSALPAYLSMADVGMVTAAGNKMTMAIGRSDLAEGNRVYQSAQLFMTIMCCSLAAILTPAVLFLPLPDYMTLDKRIALAAMLCDVLLALYGGPGRRDATPWGRCCRNSCASANSPAS